MRFLEKNWLVVLSIWIIFFITAVTIKLVFLSSVPEDTFSMEEVMLGFLQNDSRLLKYIHSNEAYPPPPSPGVFMNASIIYKPRIRDRVTRDVIKILNKKNNGVFVECRAFEGDLLSKTLDLELYYNWTGILMEPDPTLFPKLIAKRRNAWLLNACLSPDPTPHNLDFLRKISKSSMNNSSQSDQDAMMPDRKSTYRDGKGHVWRKLRIPCFPLFSVTSALQVYTIDYLILDAQGLELQILLNIPWNDLKIHVILVNVQSIPEGPSGVKFFMHSKGFTLISSTGHFYMFANENFNP